jgi:hypothetical protein
MSFSFVVKICFDKNHSYSEARSSTKLHLKINFPTSKKTQSTRHCISVTKTNWLMLFRVIKIGVYSEDHTERINSLCGFIEIHRLPRLSLYVT